MSDKKILILLFLSFIYQNEAVCSDGLDWRDIVICSAIGFAGGTLGSILISLASGKGKQPVSLQAVPQQLALPQLDDLQIVDSQASDQPTPNDSVKYLCDFIGQERVACEAQEFVDSVKMHAEYAKLGARKPKGLLIEGAIGNGKTLLAQAIVGELGGFMIPINGNLLAERVLHGGDAKVRFIFDIARQISKERFTVLFIDDFDVVAKNNQSSSMSMPNDRTAYTLRACIENIKENEKILVIGATTSSVKVDQKFLTPDCLEKIIHIPLPTYKGRKAILQHYLKGIALEKDEVAESISEDMANRLAGFSVAQLKASVEDAALLAARSGCLFVEKEHFEKISEKLLLNKNRIDDSKQEDQFFYTFGDKTRFKDVIGVADILDEITEAVSFVKKRDYYGRLGARSPKGLLLHGPSGCGKTLIARAIAGEGGCCFISISGSEFVKKYVGTGAMTVNLIFDFARKMSREIPVIIFIDEIDGLGHRRTIDASSGQSEYNNTINELLKQMDGFSQNDNILVIGATNLISELDPALMRPGRFDRKVFVSLPCLQARKEIAKHYLGKISTDEYLKSNGAIELLARRSVGFSGADIEHIVNEAAIIAVRKNAECVTIAHIDEATDRVTVGAKNSFLRTEEERKRTAYHEAGHAVAAILCGLPVKKISILSRGDSLGVTMYESKESWELSTEKDLFNRMIAAQGGYVAEKLFCNLVADGVSDDLRKSGEIASTMVRILGMGENDLEAIAESSVPGLSSKFDEAVAGLQKRALAKTKELLDTHKDFLSALADKLLMQESLDEKEIASLQQSFHIVAIEQK